MKGDFSRNTFDPSRHFARVLMQQGRVQLDADWNEQAAILLHYLRSLAADLIGPFGYPGGGADRGFEIEWIGDDDLGIGSGHYYVDGILCENEDSITYFSQPDYPIDRESCPLDDLPFLVYLDVWERHITQVEDSDPNRPGIREPALGQADTASRAQVVWQVKIATQLPCWDEEDEEQDHSLPDTLQGVETQWKAEENDWVRKNKWQVPNRGRLKALAKREAPDTILPCAILPDARYTGLENQLYRVEIHRRGEAWDQEIDEQGNPAGNADAAATFKWSRDNASIIFPIDRLVPSEETTTVTLEHLGRDDRSSLEPGDWVEIVDDDYALTESDRRTDVQLLQVKGVDRTGTKVILKGTPPAKVGKDPAKHPLLRRWDHRAGDPNKGGLALHDGAALIVEGSGKDGWLRLEDGVRIQFQPGEAYRPGDYWLIPARTATGDVEWPGLVGEPEAVPPHGVEHRYAPLALMEAP